MVFLLIKNISCSAFFSKKYTYKLYLYSDINHVIKLDRKIFSILSLIYKFFELELNGFNKHKDILLMKNFTSINKSLAESLFFLQETTIKRYNCSYMLTIVYLI